MTLDHHSQGFARLLNEGLPCAPQPRLWDTFPDWCGCGVDGGEGDGVLMGLGRSRSVDWDGSARLRLLRLRTLKTGATRPTSDARTMARMRCCRPALPPGQGTRHSDSKAGLGRTSSYRTRGRSVLLGPAAAPPSTMHVGSRSWPSVRTLGGSYVCRLYICR